jgi:hypothetical protein
MNIDADSAWEAILNAVRASSSVGDGMRQVIGVCSSSFPHRDWSRFAGLEYETDVVEYREWISSAFQAEPAPFAIRGLYFGLFNPIRESQPTADLRLAATDRYDPKAEGEWISISGSCWHRPSEDCAYSTVLDSIYALAYGRKSGLGNDAEWSLALAYAALFVRSLLIGASTALIDHRVKTIGVVVGFDSGDSLRIGELRETGFNVLT